MSYKTDKSRRFARLDVFCAALRFHNRKWESMRKTILLRKDIRFCVAECTNELCNVTMVFAYNPRRVNIHDFMHDFGVLCIKNRAV